MKIKNMFTAVIAGACLIAFAGAASAATTYQTGTGSPTMPTSDVNIWGASAQYTFWKREFPNYLTAAGCTLGVSGATSDGKNFIQQATCGSNTINFRVSSKSSYDGPLAIDGNTTHPNRTTTCADPAQRPMIDASTCSGGTCAAPTAANCVPVTIGASDVLVADFVQSSSGALSGPLGGTATSRNFLTNPVTVSANVTNLCRPLAIPFSFFVNKSVTLANGTTIMSNISSAEAKMIFSGVIKNWSDLAAVSMFSQPVNVCYRHAGSGTHASLDAFMRPMTMLKTAVTGGTSAHYYFNDGSSDEMKCINGSGTWTGTGAIGYADADQDLTSYGNTARLALDNNQPITANVDDYTWPFATVQNVYVATANATNPVLLDICTYAGQPSLVHFNNANWSASCQMKHVKDSNFGNFRPNPDYLNANCN